MAVEDFSRLAREVSGRTSAMSLYYLGDPLTHPDLTELCAIAKAEKIYTHVSTNFSFNLTDEKIEDLATCGLNHLTVCVDGLTQEVYERTRVGGKITKVLDNLKRVCDARTRLRSGLVIEVQFILHDSNRSQLIETQHLMEELGVDVMTSFQGADYTMEEIDPRNYQVLGPAVAGLIPNCYWPYFFMTIKWNGDVIPCCSFRQDEQYDPNRPKISILGNIFDKSVSEVWNSHEYQNARTFVSNPKDFMKKTQSEHEFCYGCERVCKRIKLPTTTKMDYKSDISITWVAEPDKLSTATESVDQSG